MIDYYWHECGRNRPWHYFRHYHGICLVELKITMNINQDSWFPDRHVNPGHHIRSRSVGSANIKHILLCLLNYCVINDSGVET